jgi:hypothetical protein
VLTAEVEAVETHSVAEIKVAASGLASDQVTFFGYWPGLDSCPMAQAMQEIIKSKSNTARSPSRSCLVETVLKNRVPMNRQLFRFKDSPLSVQSADQRVPLFLGALTLKRRLSQRQLRFTSRRFRKACRRRSTPSPPSSECFRTWKRSRAGQAFCYPRLPIWGRETL